MNNQIKKKHIDLEAPFNKESYHRWNIYQYRMIISNINNNHPIFAETHVLMDILFCDEIYLFQMHIYRKKRKKNCDLLDEFYMIFSKEKKNV